jgi:hypothetical protein
MKTKTLTQIDWLKWILASLTFGWILIGIFGAINNL